MIKKKKKLKKKILSLKRQRVLQIRYVRYINIIHKAYWVGRVVIEKKDKKKMTSGGGDAELRNNFIFNEYRLIF